MTKHVLFLGLLFFMIACNNSTPDENARTPISDSKTTTPGNDTSVIYKTTDAIWDYQLDSTLNDLKPIRLRPVIKDTLTPEMIVGIVNKTWPTIQVKYLRISRDTIFISIPNSVVLTQQIGTTGAIQFLVSTTFTFTELKGINYVNYDFEEGDHAVPGVYNRTSWNLNL